jgi:hypothetical protein
MAAIDGSVRNLSIDQMRELMTCPLSYALFEDPVTEKGGVCGGHTFERVWIDVWLGHNRQCPLTRTHLMGIDLISNVKIRDACKLLDKERKDPLSQNEMEVIYKGAEALLQRRSPHEAPQRVPQEIHDNIFENIFHVMREGTDATSETTGCSVL